MAEFYMPDPIDGTVTGYHGTTMAEAHRLIAAGEFVPSDGAGEWLGHGVYFWTTSSIAWWWARKKSATSPAVIRATLMLGYCLDCSDGMTFEPLLKLAHDEVMRGCGANYEALPKNDGDDRALDCRVFNCARKLCFPAVDSVRAFFQAGDPVYDGGPLHSRTHVQICMTRLDYILWPKLMREEEV